jgi:hypothetical protein
MRLQKASDSPVSPKAGRRRPLQKARIDAKQTSWCHSERSEESAFASLGDINRKQIPRCARNDKVYGLYP